MGKKLYDKEYTERHIQLGKENIWNQFKSWRNGKGINPIELLELAEDLMRHYEEYQGATVWQRRALSLLIDQLLTRTQEEADWYKTFAGHFGGQQ